MPVGKIEAERERQRMSREQVAAYLGVSIGTYLQWMQGQEEIPCTAIAKMARLWRVSSDYLLGLAPGAVD